MPAVVRRMPTSAATCRPRRNGAADGGQDGGAVVSRRSIMKPHVICHMVSSVDGRTWQSRRGAGGRKRGTVSGAREERGEGEAGRGGRVPGGVFAKRAAYPGRAASQPGPRTPWFARRDAAAWGIVLDAQGKIAWGRSD